MELELPKKQEDNTPRKVSKIDRLEYLKLLIPKGEQSARAFNIAVSRFYLFFLVFFLFSLFRSSELTLFGAKFDIPHIVFVIAAPLVLSFLYFRIANLYELQEHYKSEIEHESTDLLGKSDNTKYQAARISNTLLWFVSSGMMENKRNCLYVLIYLLAFFSTIVTIFYIPLVIIGYFCWLVYQSNTIAFLFRILIILIAVIFSISGLFLTIQQLRAEQVRQKLN